MDMKAALQIPKTPAHSPVSSLPRSPIRLLQRKCACGGAPGIDGECEECRNKRLQRKAAASRPPNQGKAVAPPIVHEVLRSPGQPLEADTRAFFELRFGSALGSAPLRCGSDPVRSELVIDPPDSGAEVQADRIVDKLTYASDSGCRSPLREQVGHNFGHVRIHRDEPAVLSAKSVNASAYTIGDHIVFGAGRYSPQTREGMWLMAHELTHVVQQSRGEGGPITPRAVQRQEAGSESRVPDSVDDESKGPDSSSKPLLPIPVFDELDPTISVPDVPGVPDFLKGQAFKLSYVKKALGLLRGSKKGGDDCGAPFIGFEKARSGQFKGLCCKGSDRSSKNCCNWRDIDVLDNRCCTGLEINVDGKCVPVELAPPAPLPLPPPAAPPEFNDLPGSTLPPDTALA